MAGLLLGATKKAHGTVDLYERIFAIESCECASRSVVMRYASCAGREVSRATVAGSAETGNVGRRPVNKRTVQLTSVTESSPSSRTNMRRVGSESHARRHPGRRCGCHIARAFARAACLLDTRPVRAAAVRPSL